MLFISNFLVAIIALLHFYFLILEMFLWTKPVGLKIFRQSLESAQATSILAANQGLYNGFLAAGLLWSLVQADPEFQVQIKIFFLVCVITAGIYGAKTLGKKIFFIQALPALIALALTCSEIFAKFLGR